MSPRSVPGSVAAVRVVGRVSKPAASRVTISTSIASGLMELPIGRTSTASLPAPSGATGRAAVVGEAIGRPEPLGVGELLGDGEIDVGTAVGVAAGSWSRLGRPSRYRAAPPMTTAPRPAAIRLRNLPERLARRSRSRSWRTEASRVNGIELASV
jgi:hypothetical protein